MLSFVSLTGLKKYLCHRRLGTSSPDQRAPDCDRKRRKPGQRNISLARCTVCRSLPSHCHGCWSPAARASQTKTPAQIAVGTLPKSSHPRSSSRSTPRWCPLLLSSTNKRGNLLKASDLCLPDSSGPSKSKYPHPGLGSRPLRAHREVPMPSG